MKLYYKNNYEWIKDLKEIADQLSNINDNFLEMIELYKNDPEVMQIVKEVKLAYYEAAGVTRDHADRLQRLADRIERKMRDSVGLGE